MVGLPRLSLTFCALTASVSCHLIDSSLARRTDHSTTTGVLWSSSTGLRSLHRRALSIDLNEAPTHHIDLNEMPYSDGELEHHAEGASLHVGGPASAREPQRLLSRPASPPSAQESVGEPSSSPWVAWGKRKSRKSAGLLPSTDTLPMHINGDASSSNYAATLINKGKQVDERRKPKERVRPMKVARLMEKKRLLGYSWSETLREEHKNKKLEEVVASLNNQQYIPPAKKTRTEYDSRMAEKKRLLGYKQKEKLRDEDKGWKLEDIKKSRGLDPSVPVPLARPSKKKNARGR